MERYRLKNIILLILALANMFLLSSLVVRQVQENQVRDKSLLQLTTLFHSEKYNLELQVEKIPDDTPSAVLTLTRDSKQEQRVAAFFLGREMDYSAEGGGIVQYSSAAGSAVFRADGRFEITLTQPEVQEDPEGFSIGFCRKFDYKDLTTSFQDNVETITATQYFDGHSVIDCSVVFTFFDGALQSVAGRHLPSSYTAAEARNCLSATTALTSFLQYVSENGVVCKAVTAIDLCYEPQSTLAVPLSLAPVWRLVTEPAQQFYVNAITGEVSQVVV